jgi:hypothetical protein
MCSKTAKILLQISDMGKSATTTKINYHFFVENVTVVPWLMGFISLNDYIIVSITAFVFLLLTSR